MSSKLVTKHDDGPNISPSNKKQKVGDHDLDKNVSSARLKTDISGVDTPLEIEKTPPPNGGEATNGSASDDDSHKKKVNNTVENKQSGLSASDDDKETSSTTNKITTSKDYYFDSYAHHGIHEEMLKDQVRTRTYQMAITQNQHLFKDKVVLDVGCGTGILSMFAAQAGAKHVFAIDCSNIVDQAKDIIKLNGFEDVITLIKGKVEEVNLPFEKVDTTMTSNSDDAAKENNMEGKESDEDSLKRVDIIVSEWMGYFLLYESMLDTVLYARDKWLVPKDGIILPDRAVMYLCAVEDGHMKNDRLDFWDDVYGFDMSPIRKIAIKEPVVDTIDPQNIVTNTVPIFNVDILTCTKEDLSFQSDFCLTTMRNDFVHGFVAFFECAFTQLHKPIGFSTSPSSQYTHWKQTLFYWKDIMTVCEGEQITGSISCKPNEHNNRDLDIDLRVKIDGEKCQVDTNMIYHLR